LLGIEPFFMEFIGGIKERVGCENPDMAPDLLLSTSPTQPAGTG
jgi:hypothetical protein